MPSFIITLVLLCNLLSSMKVKSFVCPLPRNVIRVICIAIRKQTISHFQRLNIYWVECLIQVWVVLEEKWQYEFHRYGDMHEVLHRYSEGNITLSSILFLWSRCHTYCLSDISLAAVENFSLIWRHDHCWWCAAKKLFSVESVLFMGANINPLLKFWWLIGT